MKKIIMLILVPFIMVLSLYPQEHDIRKLDWGMSFETVKQVEQLGDEFFKREALLGIEVDIRFGFDYRGLYSVTYSTRGKEFAVKAGNVMRGKYGDSTSGLDYSFLMQSKSILRLYPEAVVTIYEKKDFTSLEEIRNSDERKLIRNLLTPTDTWRYGNTVALLLSSPDVVMLSYWSKVHQDESKIKFFDLMKELKKMAIKEAEIKKADDREKF